MRDFEKFKLLALKEILLSPDKAMVYAILALASAINDKQVI